MYPYTIREINDLPVEEKHTIYGSLIPEWVFTDYGIDPERFKDENYPNVRFNCRKGTRSLELSVKRDPADIDSMLYLHMADTFNQQILVLLVVVNDPDAPRFNTDIDEHGNRTHFGTSSRNTYAEIAAMKAGLAPGQVRKGMRAFKHSVPIFEDFITKMGHDMFLIEPLSYHNAIVFERYGFYYLRGKSEMHSIHDQFQPGNALHNKLTPDNPFRHPDAWKTVRGRSWAIHDGILGHPFTGFQMYRRIGVDAGINTFPDSQW